MKKCPYCAEEIQDKAIKCKHCGEWLQKETKAPPQVVSEIETPKSQAEDIAPPVSDEEIKKIKEAGAKQCPICGKWDVHKAYIEDGSMGDWCPHCKKSIPSEKDKKELKGVSGWLLFFFISLTILNPIATIYNFMFSYKDFKNVFPYLPSLYYTVHIDIFFGAIIMLFSIYAGYCLWEKKKDAVKIAKIYLITFLIYTIIETIVFFIILPTEVTKIAAADTTKETFRSIIYFTIWYLYLNKSKRVKNTFKIL